MASERVCTSCDETKPLTAFSPHSAGRYGVRSRCKVCLSKKAMAWRDNNRDRVLNAYLLRSFGITLDQYRAILEQQGGGCAICGYAPDVTLEAQKGQGSKARLVVDHCHTTGRVRGLLCDVCNKGIGHLREDPIIVQLAADYLEARS